MGKHYTDFNKLEIYFQKRTPIFIYPPYSRKKIFGIFFRISYFCHMKEIYNFNPIDYGFEVFVRSEAEEVYIKSLIDNRIDNRILQR